MTALIPAIDPTRESLKRFAEEFPADAAVSMLNLLRFRELAAYAEPSVAACSGRKAYGEYSRLIEPILRAAGGKVLWVGKSSASLIAPPGEEWDEILLVQYPYKQAFLGMIQCEAYQAIVHHRTAALADSRLLPSIQASL